jgi:hypothetical protein
MPLMLVVSFAVPPGATEREVLIAAGRATTPTSVETGPKPWRLGQSCFDDDSGAQSRTP